MNIRDLDEKLIGKLTDEYADKIRDLLADESKKGEKEGVDKGVFYCAALYAIVNIMGKIMAPLPYIFGKDSSLAIIRAALDDIFPAMVMHREMYEEVLKEKGNVKH